MITWNEKTCTEKIVNASDKDKSKVEIKYSIGNYVVLQQLTLC